jgi:hypothetical protein
LTYGLDAIDAISTLIQHRFLEHGVMVDDTR